VPGDHHHRALEGDLRGHKLVIHLRDPGVALVEDDHRGPLRVAVAMLVQELQKLGVGDLRLVDPEAIQGDPVLGQLVGPRLGVVLAAAHGEGAGRHVDHRHAIGRTDPGVAQAGDPIVAACARGKAWRGRWGL
jgi:hypothetical protein